MNVTYLDFQKAFIKACNKTYQKDSLACGREDMGCSVSDKLNV